MNTASTSESGSYSTNQSRPFFYTQPAAQQPFPNPWYPAHAYPPYCVPAPGFRSGNPYLPFYSVALHEYPAYLVPQHPVQARVNRRPYFNAPQPSPVFYHATRFRHYSNHGKKMETKETQTDPRQPENKHQDIRTETKGCDAGSMTCASSGIGTETESTSEKQDSSGSSIVVDREFHNKSPSSSAQYRNLPTGSYAFEKEEVRIEYGNGSPAIQLWKSFKETIPLYNVASGKPVPEELVQRDLFSVGSCEGIIYGPREGERTVPGASLDERKAVLTSKQGVEPVQEREIQNIEVKLDAEKEVNTSQQAKCLPGETMAVQATGLARSVGIDQPVVRQDVVGAKKPSSKKSPGSKTPQEEPSVVHQAGLLPPGVEEMSNLSLQQNKVTPGHSVANGSQRDKSIWCAESAGKYVPSSSWLACLDSMDTNCDGICLPQKKRPSVLSLSSDDMSSREEGSSIDNATVAYLVPDYVLQKSTYAFQKSTEGLQKEQIKSAGSLNEGEVVGKEQMNSLNDQDVKTSVTVKSKEASCKGRKLEALPRPSGQRKISYLSKAAKSLSEMEDSEEYSVRGEEEDEDGEEEEEEDDDMDEMGYFFQEATPFGILTPGKGSFYKVGRRLLWKPP
ncbi:hypothetical protein N331_03546, partial [Merops nubicus]